MMTLRDFLIKQQLFVFDLFCDTRESLHKRYMKAPFDADKIYELISEIVDKTFIPVQEEDLGEPEPYVSLFN